MIGLLRCARNDKNEARNHIQICHCERSEAICKSIRSFLYNNFSWRLSSRIGDSGLLLCNIYYGSLIILPNNRYFPVEMMGNPPGEK